MNSFSLKIVTPDAQQFEGQVQELVVRTTTGDMGILAGHINTVAPLGMGEAMILVDGQKHYGACIGGMISVINGEVTLLPTSFEWADQIDLPRAKASKEKAQQVLKDTASTPMDIRVAKARLYRALVRESVAKRIG